MIRLFTLLLLALFPLALSAQDFCYGGANCEPVETSAKRAGTIALPGDFLALADEDRMTMVLTLPDGVTFAAPPVAVGGTAVSSSASVFGAVANGPFAITGVTLAGDFVLGDDIEIDVSLFNPNTTTVLFDGPVLVARIEGAFGQDILTLNPGSNTAQQTFLRVVNFGDVAADVLLIPTDDAGVEGGRVTVTLAPRASVQLTSLDLEAGSPEKGVTGAFGLGTGKWRVRAVSDQRVAVQVLARGGLGSIQ